MFNPPHPKFRGVETPPPVWRPCNELIQRIDLRLIILLTWICEYSLKLDIFCSIIVLKLTWTIKIQKGTTPPPPPRLALKHPWGAWMFQSETASPRQHHWCFLMLVSYKWFITSDSEHFQNVPSILRQDSNFHLIILCCTVHCMPCNIDTPADDAFCWTPLFIAPSVIILHQCQYGVIGSIMNSQYSKFDLSTDIVWTM